MKLTIEIIFEEGICVSNLANEVRVCLNKIGNKIEDEYTGAPIELQFNGNHPGTYGAFTLTGGE